MYNDDPIKSKSDVKLNVDLFGRLRFAEQMAQTLININDPSSLCIGLYGGWGTGKHPCLTC